MKKIYKKIFIFLLTILCCISVFSLYQPVQANSGISTLSYDQIDFSFKGTCSVSENMTGSFMDVKVKATASNNNNETITLDIYINNRNVTKSYTFYSDGEYHTFKNIFLGFSGGSNVCFTFTGANPEITIYMNLEMGS